MRNPSRKAGMKAPAGIRVGAGGAVSKARLEALKGVHSHGCSGCSSYYTDACQTPLINQLCKDCRPDMPHGRPSWDRDRDPLPCCRAEVRLATAQQLLTFRLGGNTAWWICTSCVRTHPYDPRMTGSTSTGGQP